MGMRAPAIATLASTVTSAIFNVTTTVGSDWMHKHLKPYVWPLWGITIIIWIWFLMARAKESGSQQDQQATPGKIAGNITGGDNTGHQYSSSGNMHVHHHAPDLTPRPTKAETPPLLLPNLKLGGCRTEMADLSHFADFGGKSRRLLYVIEVENVLPDGDGPIVIARGLSVDLRFTGAYGIQGHVSRAFWYEKSFNQVDLGGGKECSFIVGEIAAGSWVCHDNCLDRLMTYEESQLAVLEGGTNEGRSVKIPIVHGIPITVEIKIFSNRLERVLLDGQYRIIPVTKDVARMERVK